MLDIRSHVIIREYESTPCGPPARTSKLILELLPPLCATFIPLPSPAVVAQLQEISHTPALFVIIKLNLSEILSPS